MNYKFLKQAVFIFFILISSSLTLSGKQELSDSEITNAIDYEMAIHTDVPAYLVDIETSDGIVTLSGKVSNILAKERAKKIAMAVKGVRSVVNNIKADPPVRKDEKIKKDIQDALLFDPAADSYKINVSVNNGIVTATGSVNSWQEKQLALSVIKGVKGVKEINDNILFEYIEERPDFQIKKDIEATLRNNIRVDDELIEVSVKNGEVFLSGTVGSATEKHQAKMDAWVTGVEHVDAGDLEVKYWARNENLRKQKYIDRDDEEIKKAIKDAFLYDPRVKSFNPEVNVDNGLVTLTGEVDNLKAKRAAGNDARNTVGVYNVYNHIKIRPDIIPSDTDLEEDVLESLIRDPYVERAEIAINANNGKVTLRGIVENYFEKYHAEDIASEVKGVIKVNNNISVGGDQSYNEDYYSYDYYGWNTVYPTPYTEYRYNQPPKSDWEIKNRIENQIWWSPFINKDDINISVNNGIATLSGKVDTWNEKIAASENALQGGAKTVVNNIEVRKSPEKQSNSK